MGNLVFCRFLLNNYAMEYRINNFMQADSALYLA